MPHELLPHLSSFKLTQSFTQHFEILCCLQRGELQRDLEQKKKEKCNGGTAFVFGLPFCTGSWDRAQHIALEALMKGKVCGNTTERRNDQ